MIVSNGRFAVVILNYNKRLDVLNAINSVLTSDISDVDVIAVDNSSSDGSVEAIAERFPAVPLLANQANLGVSGGRNSGWRYATAHFDFEYILFLDDDAILSPDYLRRVRATFAERPDVGVVCGKAFTTEAHTTLMSVGIKANLYTGSIEDIGVGESDHGQHDVVTERDSCGGFAFCTRAALFERLGAFDEAFNPYGWEDVDFCLRAKRAGFLTLYQPAAVLVHKGSKAGRRPKASYEIHKIRNYLLLLKTHTTMVQKLSCLLFVPIRCMKVAYLMIAGGNARVIGAQAAGFFRGLLARR
jgi:GT2 family glycosyltransferase